MTDNNGNATAFRGTAWLSDAKAMNESGTTPLTSREIWAFDLVEHLIRRLKQTSELRVDQMPGARQAEGWVDEGTTHQLGSVTIDYYRREVKVAGKVIQLTPKEYGLLALLASREGAPVSYRELSEIVWGKPYDQASRCIHQVILTVRKKLESDPRNPRILRTVHRFGYRLTSDAAAERR